MASASLAPDRLRFSCLSSVTSQRARLLLDKPRDVVKYVSQLLASLMRDQSVQIEIDAVYVGA